MFSFDEPSALLSNARSTIATLIQRPSAITTSNAFDEFSILDQLIDVCNDVDRFEDGENRKFVNIAQLITASTCIYSRRVDALYKLINTFQCSSTASSPEKSESIPVLDSSDASSKKTDSSAKKKKVQHQQQQQSFICQDMNKINLNPSKTFFLDRTSHFDLQLFRNYVPIGNKQFWINDHRPMIFDLLFHDQILDHIQSTSPTEPLIDAPIPSSPEQVRIVIPEDDIPLPFPAIDEHEPAQSVIEQRQMIERKKPTRINRRKKLAENEMDLNIFRHGLTDQQQGLFRFQKFKSSNTKSKTEGGKFFQKNFHRKHFENLIKGCPMKILFPLIVNHYLSIRERYTIPIDRVQSPPPSTFDDHPSFASFPNDFQEDMDTRLQTDMEQFLDVALTTCREEKEQNETFLQLRSSISDYMSEHQSITQTNIDDLVEILPNQYSLPLIFSQLLHLCASTQSYHLHSTDTNDLILQKIL